MLHYGDLGDSLTLESVAIVAGELKADAQLRFADGTDTRLPEKIRSAAVTPETDGDDLIVDTPLGSTIESGRGNDRVVLFSGTYVYHAGHGKDVVDTYYGTIELADVTQVSQLSFDWVAVLFCRRHIRLVGESELIRPSSRLTMPSLIRRAMSCS